MTPEAISILVSGISVAFAIFFGISTRSRNTRKDTREEAAQDAQMYAKLENIQQSLIEVKTELKNYKEEMQAMRDLAIRNEESLKSLHKRVDKVEKLVETHGLNN